MAEACSLSELTLIQLIPDWLILGLQSPGPQPSAAWYTAMMALLRPRLGGGGGGSSDPPTGLEDKFRYHSHGVRAGSARRGTGECSRRRGAMAMSYARRLRRATAELAAATLQRAWCCVGRNFLRDGGERGAQISEIASRWRGRRTSASSRYAPYPTLATPLIPPHG